MLIRFAVGLSVPAEGEKAIGGAADLVAGAPRTHLRVSRNPAGSGAEAGIAQEGVGSQRLRVDLELLRAELAAERAKPVRQFGTRRR